jgi:biopolymer transport protein ExbD
MKKFVISILSTLALLLFVTSAFAASTRNLNVTMPVTVNGTAIPEGQYKLTIADDGQVTIAKGKNVLVTAQGKLVDRPAKADSDSIVVHQQPDGTQRLTEVNFGGQKSALVFTESDSKISGN